MGVMQWIFVSKKKSKHNNEAHNDDDKIRAAYPKGLHKLRVWPTIVTPNIIPLTTGLNYKYHSPKYWTKL